MEKSLGIIHAITCTSDVELDTGHMSIRIMERSHKNVCGKAIGCLQCFENHERTLNEEETYKCKEWEKNFGFSTSLQII